MKASLNPRLSPQEYERLELIESGGRSLQEWGQQAIALLARLFQSESADPGREIQIQQHRDAQGQILWSGYDPAGDRRIHRVSEERLRGWIEQRYR